MPYFSISPEEVTQANAFIKHQKETAPDFSDTVGGRFTYQFTPTSIGVLVSLLDNATGATESLTDLGSL